jgi:hypothetical protein
MYGSNADSHFFFDSQGKMSLSGEKFSMQPQKAKVIEKKLPDAKQTFHDPSRGFSGPKKPFGLRYDASMRTQQRRASLCGQGGHHSPPLEYWETYMGNVHGKRTLLYVSHAMA